MDTSSEHIKKEMEISLQAGELVGVLYDTLLKQYKDLDDQETLKSLNKLCVRLVFCLYAEDAGIFDSKSMFHAVSLFKGYCIYNNFPWPAPSDAQRTKIEQSAQAILGARALYPDSSLADLYDETTMPPELRKAYQQDDKAVMQA